MRAKHPVILAVAIMLGGCATPAILDAPTGPGTAYPCGVSGVVCTTQHTCCDSDETCGGESGSVGCPAGMCCMVANGNDVFGAKQPHPQTPWAK